jgi:hypothetical protein
MGGFSRKDQLHEASFSSYLESKVELKTAIGTAAERTQDSHISFGNAKSLSQKSAIGTSVMRTLFHINSIMGTLVM